MPQKCVVPRQVRRVPFASTLVVKTTDQVGVLINPMTTGRNQEQHQGFSRKAETTSKVISTIMLNKIAVFINRQDLTKNLNRQYSPNYAHFHPSPIGSIPGQDLSATLIKLTNIQSRSLEMMAASQRSKKEAFHELTRASKDKANDAMFTSIKTYMERTDRLLKIGLMRLTRPAESVDAILGQK